MDIYHGFIKYILKVENFYSAFAEVAKSQGLLLDFFRAEAFPCNNQNKPLSLPELKNIYGNDLPLDWKWSYTTFLEADDCLQKNLETLATAKGHDIAFNFLASDAFLGNVAVKILDKWFAIGECVNCGISSPYKYPPDCLQEFDSICITKLWSPFYVLSKIEKMEVKLKCAKTIKRRKKLSA